jgi:hypothetical protein
MVRSAEEILENVVLLISFLDDVALREVSDLPFLEMAKYVSTKRNPGREARGCTKRDCVHLKDL